MGQKQRKLTKTRVICVPHDFNSLKIKYKNFLHREVTLQKDEPTTNLHHPFRLC